ncbi:MAG: DUF4111 domain-containing protein [Vulcanimicrobiaceae bacterium]
MTGQDLAGADLDIRRFVIRIAAEIGGILGETLRGIYVHGSLAMGTFQRHCSDIDLLIVVRNKLTPSKRAALAQAFITLSDARPMNGDLEATVLQERYLKAYEHPLPYEVQYNKNSQAALRDSFVDFSRDLTDSALAVQLLAVKQRGVRLTGPRPADAIGLIPWYAFMEAVVADFDTNGKTLQRNPADAVLNACRTLHDATLPSIAIVSKEEAAEWALYMLPEHFRPMVRDAREAHRGKGDATFDHEKVQRLRDYVEQTARATFDKVRDVDDE